MPELNKGKLSEVFDIEEEINNVVSSLENSSDPDIILKDNIDRANRVLDRLELEMNTGNFSARMSEVAGQLINAVTNASSQILTDKYNMSYLQLRRSIVKLKEAEMRLKIQPRGGILNQNIIVTDRESLLEFLGKGDIKQLQNVKEDNDGGIKDGKHTN